MSAEKPAFDGGLRRIRRDGNQQTPAGLEWLRGSEAGRAWLDALPGLVQECAARWSLRLGDAFESSHVSLALRARLPDATEAVLKLQFPHRECEHEAEALRIWNGDGAVRLLEHDGAHHALLIECCRPGTHLAEQDADEALSVLVRLLPRLWKPIGPPFGTLREEAERWMQNLPRSWETSGRPFERRLLDAAVETLETLSTSQSDPVLLHQDLHPGNVLRAEREPWLAIDPKPVAGERELAVAPIVRAYELGHTRALVLHRLDRLTAELGLDRPRARGWAFAHTLSWAFGADGAHPRHVETARWLLQEPN